MPRGGRRVGAGRKGSLREHACGLSARGTYERSGIPTIEEELAEVVFRGRGLLSGTIRPGAASRAGLWKKYDNLFLTRSEVSSAILTIAGHVVSSGYVTVPGSSGDEKALEAKALCDQFALQSNLDAVIHEGSILTPLHGTVFIENNMLGKKLGGTRIFPWQEEIEPYKVEKDGKISQYQQVRNGSLVEGGIFKEGEITAIRFPPIDNHGFGTSLVSSTVDILKTREQFDKDVGEYVHLSAFAKELWECGDASDRVDPATRTAVQNAVKGWKAGQSFVTNFPIKYTACGLGRVESRIFPELIRVMNDRCVDGELVPPISYLRNATEASADAMMTNLRITIVQPIQRLWKRAIEDLFMRLLLGEGYDEKTIAEYMPRVSFTPPTEKELLLRAQRVTAIVGAKVAGPAWAQDVLDIYDPEYRTAKIEPAAPQAKPKDTDAQLEQPPEKKLAQSPVTGEQTEKVVK